MHIPDGVLDPKTTITTGIISAAALGASFRYMAGFVLKRIKVAKLKLATNIGTVSNSFGINVKKSLQNKFVKMAQMASLIFAMQMINFPVAHGTSGHLLGGVLAAIVLGPWEAIIVISLVLAIQSLIFADGGIFALGANIFNMALIGAGLSYLIYKRLTNFISKPFSIAITSWLSVVLASIGASLEIAISHKIPLALILSNMVEVHMLIGIGEAIITLGIIYLFYRKILKI